MIDIYGAQQFSSRQIRLADNPHFYYIMPTCTFHVTLVLHWHSHSYDDDRVTSFNSSHTVAFESPGYPRDVELNVRPVQYSAFEGEFDPVTVDLIPDGQIGEIELVFDLHFAYRTRLHLRTTRHERIRQVWTHPRFVHGLQLTKKRWIALHEDR